MLAAFLDLPNEILTKILTYVRPEDLNTLFGIPQFATRLQEFISLIRDEDGDSAIFYNIPLSSHYHILKDGKIPSSGLLELFEIKSLEKFSTKLFEVEDQIPKMIIITDDFPKVRTDDMDDLDLVEDSLLPREHSRLRAAELEWLLVTRVIKAQNDFTNRISFMSFTNLFQVTLEDVKVDPFSIDLPNVSTIHFINCTSGNENAFFKFPKLKNLKVTGPLHSLDKSFEYTQYPEVIEFIDVERWFRWNTQFGNLKRITVNSEGSNTTRCSINHCHFPKLKVARFCSMQTISLINIKFQRLVSLSVKLEGRAGAPLIEEIYAPNMVDFQIFSYYPPKTKNLYIPELELIKVDIVDVTNQDSSQLTLFEDVPALIFTLVSPFPLLEKINTQNLRHLCLDLELQDSTPLDVFFPNLETLEVAFPEHFLEFPQYIHAPNLKELVLFESLGLDCLDGIPVQFPILEVLRVDHFPNPLEFNSMKFHHLLRLHITIGNELRIDDCCFPKLQNLSVSGTNLWNSTTLNIEAPEMLVLWLTNVDMERLCLLNYPKLRGLTVDRVAELYLGPLDSLVYLDLSYNILRKVEHQGLPNLKHLESVQSNAEEYLEPDFSLSENQKKVKYKERFNPSLVLDEQLFEKQYIVSYSKSFFSGLARVINAD